jgi:hypothetical protein
MQRIGQIPHILRIRKIFPPLDSMLEVVAKISRQNS